MAAAASAGLIPSGVEETPWKVIKDTSYDLAVLPWGATEAHNLHLPFATDNIIGEYIAGEAARIAWEPSGSPSACRVCRALKTGADAKTCSVTRYSTPRLASASVKSGRMRRAHGSGF